VNIPGFITRNWKLKVGCFLIATVTWVGVVYAANPPGTKVISVPVPQSSIPSQFVLVHPVQDILVRVGADQNTLQSLDPSAISVTVDWSKVTHTGIYSIPVSVVSEAANIQLITPPTSVQVNVDAFKSKSVTVTIVITNPPPVGYQSGVELASPSSVVIAGPARELNGIQARVTVDLLAQKANFQAEVNVLAYDSKGVRLNDVSPLPQNVSVTIAITADVTRRIVAVLPRTEGTTSPGRYLAGVVYSPQTIQVTGPLNILNGLDSVQTAPISLNGVFGNFTETVSLVLPEGVTTTTTKITVTIEIGSIPNPPPTPSPTPTPTPTPTPGPT
jgi:YbbR domain-containing protein